MKGLPLYINRDGTFNKKYEPHKTTLLDFDTKRVLNKKTINRHIKVKVGTVIHYYQIPLTGVDGNLFAGSGRAKHTAIHLRKNGYSGEAEAYNIEDSQRKGGEIGVMQAMTNCHVSGGKPHCVTATRSMCGDLDQRIQNKRKKVDVLSGNTYNDKSFLGKPYKRKSPQTKAYKQKQNDKAEKCMQFLAKRTSILINVLKEHEHIIAGYEKENKNKLNSTLKEQKWSGINTNLAKSTGLSADLQRLRTAKKNLVDYNKSIILFNYRDKLEAMCDRLENRNGHSINRDTLEGKKVYQLWKTEDKNLNRSSSGVQ